VFVDGADPVDPGSFADVRSILGGTHVAFVQLLPIPAGKPGIAFHAAVGIGTIIARTPTRMGIHALTQRIERGRSILIDHVGSPSRRTLSGSDDVGDEQQDDDDAGYAQQPQNESLAHRLSPSGAIPMSPKP